MKRQNLIESFSLWNSTPEALALLTSEGQAMELKQKRKQKAYVLYIRTGTVQL